MARLLTARRVNASALALGTAAAAQLLLAPSALAEELPELSVSATTVEPGGSVTVWGTDCIDENSLRPPWFAVAFSFSVDDEGESGYTDENGNWSATLSTGGLAPGDYEVHAACHVDEGFDRYPSFTITVAEASAPPAPAPAPEPPRTTPPSTEAPPVAAPETSSPTPTPTVAAAEGCSDCTTIEGGGTLEPGQQLTLSYTGFQPGEQVTLVMHSTPVTLGVFTADETGSITADFTIPDDAEAGQHTLTLSGPLTGGHDINFRLAPAQDDHQTAVAANPAGTGLTLPLVLAGLGALVLLGVGATLFLRQRRSMSQVRPGVPQEAATPIAAPMA
jgi:hypothetical protein